MQSNLTYEINSKTQSDNISGHQSNNKYFKSWNSPKSKLRNNIAKIDEELLSIKEKIKTVENTPRRSQSRFSFQYISNQHKQQDENQELKICALLKELSEKESMIENMLKDMRIIEARMNSLYYENIELTSLLESEMGLRKEMEQEMERLRLQMERINDLEFENQRLKEDNIKMYKMIEEIANRHNYNLNYTIEENRVIHTQPNMTYNDFPCNKENESYYYNESQDSDMNSNTNYQSNIHNTIHNANRLDNRNEEPKPSKEINAKVYGYQIKSKPYKRHYSPYHEKSKSVELYSFNKHNIIFEEDENGNRPQQNISNPFIKIDDNQDQIKEDKSTETKKRLNNIKDQINQIQKHQLTPITKTPQNTNQNQTTSDFSIDDINTNKDTRKRGRNQNSRSSSRIKESHSLIDNQTEDNESPHHLETNLETISCDKTNKMSPLNNKVVSLLDKINQLTESLSQSKVELNNNQKRLEGIEEENETLRKQCNDKPKESLYKITESQASLVQEDNLQLSIYPTPLFFNQPIQSEKTQIAFNNSSIKKGNIFSKLKLNINTSIEDSLMKRKVKLSDNLLFKPYDKKKLLCFDITNYALTLIEFIDYSDYDTAFNKSNLTYLNCKEGIYIITGQNSDCLYLYIYNSNSLNKFANLSNNHSHGGLVIYHKVSSNENCLVCLSGWYNKKVEEFSTKKNEWSTLPEMPIERGESSFLVSNNERLFAFFGFNCPQKKCLNTIDFCYINSCAELSFQWKSIDYTYQKEPFSLYLKSHSLIAVSQNHFVILGGFDCKENKAIDSFINLTIDDESNKFVFSKVKRKLYNIDKHHLYNFNCDFSPLINENGIQYHVCFDEEERAHVISTNKMTHDIFAFD